MNNTVWLLLLLLHHLSCEGCSFLYLGCCRSSPNTVQGILHGLSCISTARPEAQAQQLNNKTVKELNVKDLGLRPPLEAYRICGTRGKRFRRDRSNLSYRFTTGRVGYCPFAATNLYLNSYRYKTVLIRSQFLGQYRVAGGWPEARGARPGGRRRSAGECHS